jgi:hypothetical protein
LQKIRFLAKNIANDQGDKIKANFDKKVQPHNFHINDFVWYKDFSPLGKNAKLTPKWQGPAKKQKSMAQMPKCSCLKVKLKF